MPIEQTPSSTILTGNAVNWFACKAVLAALECYIRTGFQVNRSYTPKAMREFVTRHTGKQYPRSEKGLLEAQQDLQEYLAKHKPDEVPRA